MTTYTEILHQQVEQLPPSYQAETSRYLEFLLQEAKQNEEHKDDQDRVLVGQKEE